MPKWKLTQLPWKWLAISIMLATIDQLTKAWVVHHLPPRQTIPILSWLVLHLCYNPGIGFSLLGNAGNLLFFPIILSMIGIIYTLHYSQQMIHSSFRSLGLACFLGGALGNLYDRFTIGAVVDFIGIYWFQCEAPVFNLADAFISIGCLLIILLDLLSIKRSVNLS